MYHFACRCEWLSRCVSTVYPASRPKKMGSDGCLWSDGLGNHLTHDILDLCCATSTSPFFPLKLNELVIIFHRENSDNVSLLQCLCYKNTVGHRAQMSCCVCVQLTVPILRFGQH